MYKDHLLQNIERELMLLKRLAAMIEERDLQFKPMDKMRNTIELMRYLSNVGEVMMRLYIKNDLDKEEWEKVAVYRSTVSIENFPDRIDEQWKAVQEYMSQITDEDLMSKEITMPNKEVMALGSAIIMGPVKWLTSYRMQLFTYLKMNGRPDISTPEAWRPVIATAA